MRWQRPARFVVALAGIGCAAAVYVYGRRAPRPVAEMPSAVLTDKEVTARGSAVKKFRTNFNKGRTTLTIEADIETAYTGGRTRLERAHFKSLKEDGSWFEIWAGVAESEGKAVTGDEPGLVFLSGSVRMLTSDGLDVNTDSATYDNMQGLATIPGPITFTRGRLSGDGVGATYDRERDVLWLLDQAHVKRAPGADGKGGMDLTAKEIGVSRPDRYMNLNENARIVEPDRTLAANQIIIHFTDDERGAELMEMRGAAHVTPSASAGKGAPDMQAEDITLEFHDDGQTLRHAMLVERARVQQTTDTGRQTIAATTIDLNTAQDGRTLTRLEARGDVDAVLPPAAGRPERTIRAATLVTGGDDSGLKTAVFDGGVTFVESAAARGARAAGGRAGAQSGTGRNATSDRLSLALGGELSVIQRAEFRGKANFTDGGMKAIADVAIHDEQLGSLELTPAEGMRAEVQDGTVKVRAQSITVMLNTHDVRGRGRVEIEMAQGRSPSGGQSHTPALFDATRPLRGIAANLSYVSARRQARLVGTPTDRPRVYQEEPAAGGRVEIKNWINAVDITVNQETGDLSANGQVESRFELDRVSAPDGARSSAPAKAPAKAAPKSAPPKGGAAPARQQTEIKANQMSYVDAERKVVYVGEAAKPATLTGPGDDVEAREIVLRLAATERALRTLEATGAMSAKFEGGREAVGDRMVFDAVTERYVLTGKPVHFKEVDRATNVCSHEQSTELIFEGKDQTIHEPAGISLRPSEPMPCATPLKSLIK